MGAGGGEMKDSIQATTCVNLKDVKDKTESKFVC